MLNTLDLLLVILINPPPLQKKHIRRNVKLKMCGEKVTLVSFLYNFLPCTKQFEVGKSVLQVSDIRSTIHVDFHNVHVLLSMSINPGLKNKVFIEDNLYVHMKNINGTVLLGFERKYFISGTPQGESTKLINSSAELPVLLPPT